MAKVERCDMDGMNRTRIIDSKTEQPSCTGTRPSQQMGHWVDLYLDYVEVVDYQGKTDILSSRQTSKYSWLENAAKVIK